MEVRPCHTINYDAPLYRQALPPDDGPTRPAVHSTATAAAVAAAAARAHSSGSGGDLLPAHVLQRGAHNLKALEAVASAWLAALRWCLEGSSSSLGAFARGFQGDPALVYGLVPDVGAAVAAKDDLAVLCFKKVCLLYDCMKPFTSSTPHQYYCDHIPVVLVFRFLGLLFTPTS